MAKNALRSLSFVMLGVWFGLLAVCVISAPGSKAADKDKLTAQEVINKHLDSIGSADKRAKVTTRVVSGTCKFTAFLSTGGTSTTSGPAVLASDGPKSLIAASFPSPTYPFEKLGYDGKKLTTGFITPGLRSTLGDFMLTYTTIFREGLITGSLSASWPLWNMSAHDAKLEYGGTKKINGRDTYVLRYNPRKGSDFDIKLYFDAETFQHVRSDYTRTIESKLGAGVDNSSSQRESRYGISENYSDFRAEGGLTLPHTYKLEITIDSQIGTSRQDWEFTLNQFTFNDPLDPVSFNMEGAPAK